MLPSAPSTSKKKFRGALDSLLFPAISTKPQTTTPDDDEPLAPPVSSVEPPIPKPSTTPVAAPSPPKSVEEPGPKLQAGEKLWNPKVMPAHAQLLSKDTEDGMCAILRSTLPGNRKLPPLSMLCVFKEGAVSEGSASHHAVSDPYWGG